jgi:hypothetical protein
MGKNSGTNLNLEIGRSRIEDPESLKSQAHRSINRRGG